MMIRDIISPLSIDLFELTIWTGMLLKCSASSVNSILNKRGVKGVAYCERKT